MLQLKKIIRDLAKHCDDDGAEMAKLLTETHKFEIGSLDDLFKTAFPVGFESRAWNVLESYTEDTILPYPTCWFEYVVDRKDIYDVELPKKHPRCGLLVHQLPQEHDSNKHNQKMIISIWQHSEGWLMSPVAHTVFVDDAGKPWCDSHKIPSYKEISGYNEYTNEHQETETKLCTFVLMATLILFNCRGIDKLLTQEKSKPFNKKQRRKLKTPDIFTYKILKLKFDRKSSEKTPHQGGKNRRHWVMAHKSTYTAEKPLFGKYVGDVIIPAHERGDIELGFVAKSYKR